MLQVFSQMKFHDHEQVVFCQLGETGLKAIIAIHDTTLGPALGGTRMWPYRSETEAIHDVLNLSRDMTYKAAAAGLKLGGGKAVIIGDSKKDKSEELFRSYGRFVDTLGGRYITSEDVGTEVADLELVRKETEFAVGTNPEKGGSGDPSPMTALGVFYGMIACLKREFQSSSVEGKRIAVQGAGKVGSYLVWKLVENGAEVIVSDVDEEKIRLLQGKDRVETCSPDEIYDQECDIFAPCALGGVLNQVTIPRLKCNIIAGGANNQLESPDYADELHKMGILYVPDYVVNAGGLINVASERESFDRGHVEREVKSIEGRIERLISMSEDKGETPLKVANGMVEEILRRTRSEGHHFTLCPR